MGAEKPPLFLTFQTRNNEEPCKYVDLANEQGESFVTVTTSPQCFAMIRLGEIWEIMVFGKREKKRNNKRLV